MIRARSVAALYDIHGNLPALEAVLAEPDVTAADLVLVGGDALLGPFPRETLDLLRGLGERAAFIRGNADRIIGELPPDDVWAERNAWVAAELGEAGVAEAMGWPETVAVEVAGLGPTLFCHGSPRSDSELLTPATTDERLGPILAGVAEPVVVCGHTHVQFDRRLDAVRLVNAGSVGMAYEGEPGVAAWALLGPDVELRRTPFDVDATAAAVRAGGFPGADEFVEEYVLRTYTAAEVTQAFEEMAARGGYG
jgi:predicted phosphodiesterase